MDDPSKPMPSLKRLSLSSSTGIEKCCQRPGRSMNLKSTILTCRSLAISRTSLGDVRGWAIFGPVAMTIDWSLLSTSCLFADCGRSFRKMRCAKNPQAVGIVRIWLASVPRDLCPTFGTGDCALCPMTRPRARSACAPTRVEKRPLARARAHARAPLAGGKHSERRRGHPAIINGVPKYGPLQEFLAGLPRGQKQVTLGFRRVEELLGEALPPSALTYEQ